MFALVRPVAPVVPIAFEHRANLVGLGPRLHKHGLQRVARFKTWLQQASWSVIGARN